MHTPRRQTAYSLRFVAGNPDRLLVSILLTSDRPEGIGVHRGDQRQGRELGRARNVFDALDGVIQVFEQQRQPDAGGQAQHQSYEYRASAPGAHGGGARQVDDAHVIGLLPLLDLGLVCFLQKVVIERLCRLDILFENVEFDRGLILLYGLGLGGLERVLEQFLLAAGALSLGLQTVSQVFCAIRNQSLQFPDLISHRDDLRVFRAEGGGQLRNLDLKASQLSLILHYSRVRESFGQSCDAALLDLIIKRRLGIGVHFGFKGLVVKVDEFADDQILLLVRRKEDVVVSAVICQVPLGLFHLGLQLAGGSIQPGRGIAALGGLVGEAFVHEHLGHAVGDFRGGHRVGVSEADLDRARFFNLRNVERAVQLVDIWRESFDLLVRQWAVDLRRRRIECRLSAGALLAGGPGEFPEDRPRGFHQRPTLIRLEERRVFIEPVSNDDLREQWIRPQQQQVSFEAIVVVQPEDRFTQLDDRRIIIIESDHGGRLIARLRAKRFDDDDGRRNESDRQHEPFALTDLAPVFAYFARLVQRRVVVTVRELIHRSDRRDSARFDQAGLVHSGVRPGFWPGIWLEGTIEFVLIV